MKKLTNKEAYQRVKARRAKKNLDLNDIGALKIIGEAAMKLTAGMRFRDKVQAKAKSR